MRELKVYVSSQPGKRGRVEPLVYYTRRADGPFYRWLYESEAGQWNVSRVSPSKVTLRVLCAASWAVVPITLKARLSEHYLE